MKTHKTMLMMLEVVVFDAGSEGGGDAEWPIGDHKESEGGRVEDGDEGQVRRGGKK